MVSYPFLSASQLLRLASISEKIGFGIALVSNITLLLLLLYKSNAKFGTYKHLMISYTLIEMMYSITGTTSNVGAHISDDSYVIFRHYYGPNRTIGPLFILQYCTMVFSLLLILAVHFIYRFCATCSTNLLSLFNGYRLLIWVFGSLAAGAFSAFVKYIFLGENDYTTEKLRPIFLEEYGLTMEQIVYNGPTFYICDNDNNCHMSLKDLLTMTYIYIALFSCFFLMTVFGLKTYLKLHGNSRIISQKTCQVQKQLLFALIIQTVIPIIFVYIPSAVLFGLPIFNIRIGAYANLVMVCLAIYPPLDQIAIIYIIRDFRDALKGSLCGFHQNKTKMSQATLS